MGFNSGFKGLTAPWPINTGTKQMQKKKSHEDTDTNTWTKERMNERTNKQTNNPK